MSVNASTKHLRPWLIHDLLIADNILGFIKGLADTLPKTIESSRTLKRQLLLQGAEIEEPMDGVEVFQRRIVHAKKHSENDRMDIERDIPVQTSPNEDIAETDDADLEPSAKRPRK